MAMTDPRERAADLERQARATDDIDVADWLEQEAAECRAQAVLDRAQAILSRPHKGEWPRPTIEQVIGELPKMTYREREIIKLRYGLGDGYFYTREEVGRIFKVTRERVRQVELKGLAKAAKCAIL